MVNILKLINIINLHYLTRINGSVSKNSLIKMKKKKNKETR